MVRLNPSEQIQIRMISQEKLLKLPNDRETLFYFNVREIPPKQIKNVMQVTMQHALKLFWRPKAIELEDDGVMSYEKVEIIRRMMVRSALTIRCLITLRWVISEQTESQCCHKRKV